MRIKMLVLAVGFGVVMGGCAKTQEVVQPMSSLETSLQPTLAATPTQKPWPTSTSNGTTSTSSQPTGAPTPTYSVTTASTAAMTSQPQTGPSSQTVWLTLMLLVGGMGLVLWGMQGQVKGKSHARRK